MKTKGLIIDTPAFDVFEQMAADEVMCQDIPAPFILRFFRWREAGATFGYSQRYGEVLSLLGEKKGMENSIVRRPTGGGLVFHDSDMTFSCIFEMPGTLYPVEIYTKLHRAIHSGLKSRGVACALWSARAPEPVAAAGARLPPAMVCFVKPVRMDLVELDASGNPGTKILGGALRRFGDHILYQGSLQVEGARKREPEFQLAIARSLAMEWSLEWSRHRPDTGVIERVRALSLSKYRTEDWNRRI